VASGVLACRRQDMKILVINGSPKGEYSITYQTARYLHMKFPDDQYNVLHVAANIDQFGNDILPVLIAMEEADLILFCYPVYSMLAPSQMMHFMEIIKASKVRLSGKYMTQVTTSEHFFDMTAHRYIEENCNDLGMKVLPGLSQRTGDLLTKKGQLDAIKFWSYIRHCVMQDEYSEEKNIAERKYVSGRNIYTPSISKTAKDAQYKVLIITDCAKEDQQLRNMIIDFRHALKYESTVENLHYKHFKAGCNGCLKCAVNSKCIYKDGFELLIQNKLAMADAVVFAFNIVDHSTGYVMQMYEDRQFCSPLHDIIKDKPIAYITSGDLADEDNLCTVLEARAEMMRNFIAGYATDEENTEHSIQKTADKLSYALYHRMSLPETFYGMAGARMLREIAAGMQNAMLMHPVQNMRGLSKAWKDGTAPYERLMRERNIEETKDFPISMMPNVSLPEIPLPELNIPEIKLKKFRHSDKKQKNK
jgi:multimeric flavodoxin WrbA